MAAIAKTSLRESIQRIDVRLCGVSKKMVREMAEKLGFTKIENVVDKWF
jgi:ribosomal protein S14